MILRILCMKQKKNLSGRIFNISRKLYLKKMLLPAKLLESINRILFSCEIPPSADIHPNAIFGHNALGIVINEQTFVGENTVIMHQVTIGGNMGKYRLKDKQKIYAPTIGKNVMICTGAKILGPIIIGDYAQIGAGAVVHKDVPNKGVAVGIPATTIKVLSDKEAIEAYSKI